MQDIIDEDYPRILNGPYYVRTHILPRDTGIYFPRGEYRLTNSEVPEKGNEIPFRISSGSRFERATLKKIGILSNVVDGQSSGIAELRLKDSDGREHSAAGTRVVHEYAGEQRKFARGCPIL
ncbi:hypothetical protein [Paraburkholderia saeva]|uniref:Uncharacterized protein n=1 Tax=Paraburkholderia saeva TaxID=2777537 RepID=A0A9N8RSN6_9BURK|nr:hypothetical protein [Paraburkholderia saeva]CAG4886597.1 hypothetical protein LMG31841_00224 [Paraburkholderia saeva]CAG4887109.1 hypothetical protein R70241_00336 [Paraburkholderia saeva]CAG4902150.1 hypothetical protein R52603_02936 [Paraburkholderia saeva]